MSKAETDELKTERVTMLWPPSVKTAVRERVGARGLSQFVLEAVAVKLAEPVEQKETPKVRQAAPEVEVAASSRATEPEEDLHKPMALTKPKPGQDKGDLFKRIQAQVPGLVPASEILKQEEKAEEPAPVIEDPRVELQRQVELPSQPAPALQPGGHVHTPPEPAPELEGELCEVCGSVLVSGSCWECF